MASLHGNSPRALLEIVNATERSLVALLDGKDPTFQAIDGLLSQYRSATERLIFLDFDLATKEKVEVRLWDAHGRVNRRYRKYLARFRDEEGKKKPVEKRKMNKHYLDFIKSSQRFYRGYIQRLASHFAGIPELEKVAKKFNLDTLHGGTPLQVSPELRYLIKMSCHQTLIRLGDLSRYRETELRTKDRNWAPAVGYYDLAGTIYPASGASHNQHAVIALADGNHLRAMYHLYRALSVEEPHPTAQDNLEIEFKKILGLQSRNQLFENMPGGKTPVNNLVGWFMCLHARCYQGVEFTSHEDLENEVLTTLTIELKEHPLDGRLQKLVLMNIAAQKLTQKRFEQNSENGPYMQSFLFFFRLNVKMLFTLLQILQPEVERFVGGDMEDDAHADLSERLTAVARRVLPALRNYSSWLVTDANLSLLANFDVLGDGHLQVQIKEFWKSYAHALTLLVNTFPVDQIKPVDYLLEEDVNTIGFTPLMSHATKTRYFRASDIAGDPEASYKPSLRDGGLQRSHPNAEMLARIRDFVLDGLTLVADKSTPIESSVSPLYFEFREHGLPSEVFARSHGGHHHSLSSTSVGHEDIQEAKKNGMSAGGADAATTASFSAGTEMENMVNEIVESDGQTTPQRGRRYQFVDTAVEGNNTSQGHSRPYVIADVVNEMVRTPSGTGQQAPRPLLPSIENSPFALQPGEQSPQSRPTTAHRVSPPHGTETVVPRSLPMSASNSQSSFSRPNSLRPNSSGISYQDQLQLNNQLQSALPSTVQPPSSFETPQSHAQSHAFGQQGYQASYAYVARESRHNRYGPGYSGLSESSSPDHPESQSSGGNFGAIGGPVIRPGKATPPSGQGEMIG